MQPYMTQSSDKEIRAKIKEWSERMFNSDGGSADINSVMLYTPLIQLAQNELTTRYTKTTTFIAMVLSGLALAVSATALVVSTQA